MAQKAIGPTFHDELVAAGVTDWRFAWSEDGTITPDPAMTQQALVEQVYAAHDPTKPSSQQVAAGVQSWLDATVRAAPFNFNDIGTAVTYANSTIDLWHRQGVYIAGWRDAVWQKVFQIQADVASGAQQAPASIDAFIALLPQPEIPTT